VLDHPKDVVLTLRHPVEPLVLRVERWRKAQQYEASHLEIFEPGDHYRRVVKNTLARRAAEAAGFPQLQDEIKGPVAIAFGYDDLGVPSKLINEFVRATRLKLEVVGGLVEGRVFSSSQIKQLADLPSRETLIAQLMGTLQSPVAQLVGIMQTPLQQLMGTLNAYKTKLEAS